MAFSDRFSSVVNNAGYDPLQGFDADVWVLDQGTGSYNLVGRFTSIQIVIRNATEPYMEYNQRFPRHLDGDIQIGWVMERGQLDARVFEQTFGLRTLSRELQINRMPRFQITFQLKADELNEKLVNDGQSDEGYFVRQANGQIILSMCKIDTFTMGSTAGRQVIANRWEGMAEGVDLVDNTLGYNGLTTSQQVLASTAISERLANSRDSNTVIFPWDLTNASTQGSLESAITNDG